MTVTVSALASNLLGYYPQINSLNDEGVAVGIEALAALWQNGTVAWLAMNDANSINDLGQIAGTLWNPSANFSSAELWQNGKATALPSLGGTLTSYSDSANGINNAGQIVGSSAASGGLIEACLWQNGTVTNLGTLPGGTASVSAGYINSSAAAINGSGQIVGYSLVAGNKDHAFLWQNGVMTDLGVFAAGDNSIATAINSSGQVVGYDAWTNQSTRAFLWQNGKMTNLGTLPDSDYSTAESINASGVIVGQAGLFVEPSGHHAVMWQNGKIIDLNTLLAPNSGWYLQSADAINDNGVIVGHGTLLNGSGDGTYEMIITGAAVVIGSSVQSVLQTGVTTPSAVVDSGANVLASLDALETLWNTTGMLDSITLTDAAVPHWAMTSAQYESDFYVLNLVQSPFTVTMTGAVHAFDALPSTMSVAAPLQVADSSADISAVFDGLTSAVAAGEVGTISIVEPFADIVSVLSLTVAQYDKGGVTLSHISGGYQLAIVDTPANLSANFDQLQTLTAAGKISDIEFSTQQSATLQTQTLSLTSAQFANDQGALSKILYDSFMVMMTPSSSTDTIDGEGYAVTVVLPGNSSLYSVAGAGNATGFTLSGNGVDDRLNDVTALQFADHTLFVASQTPVIAGGISSFQITSLYAAVLAREPDAGGLSFYELYVSEDPSSDIVTYAEFFLKSKEYTANSAHTYAQTAQGDAQFITDTYSNLLHRAPEAGAVSFYQDHVINPMLSGLTVGTTAYTQAELLAHATVLTYFSHSAEFLDNVAVTAQHPADGSHWLLVI